MPSETNRLTADQKPKASEAGQNWRPVKIAVILGAVAIPVWLRGTVLTSHSQHPLLRWRTCEMQA